MFVTRTSSRFLSVGWSGISSQQRRGYWLRWWWNRRPGRWNTLANSTYHLTFAETGFTTQRFSSHPFTSGDPLTSTASQSTTSTSSSLTPWIEFKLIRNPMPSQFLWRYNDSATIKKRQCTLKTVCGELLHIKVLFENKQWLALNQIVAIYKI